jgi:SAM-dependent methyltransferase
MATTIQIDKTAGEKSRLDWSEHWSEGKQQSFSQRFFSFYRQAVFARAVAYFIDRYFPPRGDFVEAGCGTAETSIRIDKRGGQRKLLATDIVQPVLKQCHPVMDERVCGDIFHLPYADASVDGIWNVGVMEHFTQTEIDAILREFHRVLKPGERIILLIPGADSPPQKILRLFEFFINLRRPNKDFRFHPPEISQLRSKREGEEMLRRNSFRLLRYESGWRSLFAFKTLVAVKQ